MGRSRIAAAVALALVSASVARASVARASERRCDAATSARLTPLRYLLFGDSLTETARVLDDGTYVEGVRENWPTYFRSLVNAAALVNYARSGAAYRDRPGLESEWQKVSHQVRKAAAHRRVADVIIVAAGTNDGTGDLGDSATAMGKNAPTDLDLTKLHEALRWTFWQIRTSWPKAACFAALPIQQAGETPDTNAPLRRAIRDIAGLYGCVIVDAHHESGIESDFEVKMKAGRDLYDGLHPATSGQKKMAQLFARAVAAASCGGGGAR